jgi:hypothetical protein
MFDTSTREDVFPAGHKVVGSRRFESEIPFPTWILPIEDLKYCVLEVGRDDLMDFGVTGGLLLILVCHQGSSTKLVRSTASTLLLCDSPSVS